MAWRVIDDGDRQWQVSAAAERQPNSRQWSLVFYFRTPGRAAVWVPASVLSPSKAGIYLHADRTTDETLRRLLRQATANEGPV